MFSMQTFQDNYATANTELVIRGEKFNFFIPQSIENFVDHEDVFHEFPLWAKIWEASIILADHLAGIPPDPQKRMLEIGCGLGVVGIVASHFGHRVTLTEYSTDALNFARANAQRNNRSDMEFSRLDWKAPRIDGRFDYLVGSEVVYKEEDYQPLRKIFGSTLRPGGQIILAEGIRKTSMQFFSRMTEFFDIKGQRKTFRSETEETKVILCTMTPK
jgi:predicted nicotinamide N-methyase